MLGGLFMRQTTKSQVIISLILFSLLYCNIGNQIINHKNITDVSSSAYECVDAWIIVAGDRDDHDKWDLILLTTEWVYDRALDCGIHESNIYYLVPDQMAPHTTREDGLTTDANLDYAFSSWAPTRVGSDGLLGVYLFDHGGVNDMAIFPNGGYTAQECDDDLDAFEVASGCDRILLIYEACESGTWMDELSKSNRIIMFSTYSGYSSFPSPLPPHRGMFAEGFFTSLVTGNSIAIAFMDATEHIKNLGYEHKQYPCIDDNHDGVAHITHPMGWLPNGGDGHDSFITVLCVDCPSTISIFLPEFLKVPLKTWHKYNVTVVKIPMSVEVGNSTEISTCYVRAIPSDWFPPDPPDNETLGGIDLAEDTYRHELTYDSATGNFTGEVELWSPIQGDYNLSFVIEDVDEYRGKVIATQVGLNVDGIPPPDDGPPSVYVSNVYNGDKLSEKTTIYVIGNDEESGLEELTLEINGETVETMQMPDYLPYPVLIYELDPYEYKRAEELKITGKAKDRAGASSFFDVFVEIDIPIKWLNVTLIAGGAGVVAVAATIVGLKIVKKKR